jgi:flagellar motor protein MotB
MSYIGQRRGDSYLASLSDLMIGLLFIFIIILMAFALSYKSTQESSEHERAALQAENTALTDSDALRASMLTQIRGSLLHQGVRVKIDANQGVLRLPESLLFDEGSADFRPGGEEAVIKLGTVLADVLPCYTSGVTRPSHCLQNVRGRLESIFIEGHTDNTPISNGQFHDNWDLSVARARNTYSRLLQDDGIGVVPSLSAKILARLKNSSGQFLFSMSAYGDKRPVGDNGSPAGRAQNRRIDLRFIMAPPDVQDAGSNLPSSPVLKLLENAEPSRRPNSR